MAVVVNIGKVLAAIDTGLEPKEIAVGSGGRGRPSKRYSIGDMVLTDDEYDFFNAIRKWASNRVDNTILTDDEFIAMQKAAAPKLQKRMIEMALVSDRLSDVRAVAADLADRGYGKAASQINLNVGVTDMRNVWKQLEDRGKVELLGDAEMDGELVNE